MNKIILVTGGCGFIGSNLIGKLLNDLTCIRFYYKSINNMKYHWF